MEESDSRKKEEKEKKIQGKGRVNPHGPSFLVQAVEKGSATDGACGIKKEQKYYGILSLLTVSPSPENRFLS